jgi:ABC-2 type transport system permease protein
MLIATEDTSALGRSVVASVMDDSNLEPTVVAADTARERVRRGESIVAVVVPAGFGESVERAFFAGGGKPQLQILYDPSHPMERAMVAGLMTQHVMEAVLRGRPDLSQPYAVREEAVTARANVTYNGYAHAFAGMGIQFLLFAAINLGIEVLAERQRGLWKRLRSAPISRAVLLGGKLSSATVIGAMVLFVSFAFAIIVWRVRITGSVIGFLGVGIACALMAASYGLLVASLGKTPNAARGASIFATLLMVMLGGAWVPTFIFPMWLQQLTVVVPTRWAVDGFDAMTWRGLGFQSAVLPIVLLLGFALLFTTIAVWRFRWEEA